MSSAARVTKPPIPRAPQATAFGRPIRPFTVDEYHRMIATGIFDTGPRCELIHGIVLEKRMPNPPHATVVSKLMRRFLGIVGDRCAVRVQQPITLPENEPEPDLAVANGSDDDYATAHPGPKDLILVVEVSDSSLAFDRGTKLAMYASEKVAQYWIVNVEERRVEVYTQPRGGKNPGYKQHTNYGPDDAVPVVVRGQELGRIPVNELLP